MNVESWSIPLAGLALAAGQVGVAMVTLRGKANSDTVEELRKRTDTLEARIQRCEDEREQCERDRVRLLERIAQLTALVLCVFFGQAAYAQGSDPSGTPPAFYAPTYCYTSAGGGAGTILVVIASGNPVCDFLAVADVCDRQGDADCAARMRKRAESAAVWRYWRDKLTLGLL